MRSSLTTARNCDCTSAGPRAVPGSPIRECRRLFVPAERPSLAKSRKMPGAVDDEPPDGAKRRGQRVGNAKARRSLDWRFFARLACELRHQQLRATSALIGDDDVEPRVLGVRAASPCRRTSKYDAEPRAGQRP